MKKTIRTLVICLDKIPSVTQGVLKLFNYHMSRGSFIYKYINSFEVKYKDFANVDILVLVRATTKHELRISKLARKHKKFLVYYLDDDLLNLPIESGTYQYMQVQKTRQNMKDIMRECDLLWTTNLNIVDKYKEYFSRTACIDVPYKIEKKMRKEGKDCTKIMFAGSIDHTHSINLLLKHVIEYLISKHGDKVTFIFIGGKPDFVDQYRRVKYYSYRANYLEYLSLVNEVDPDIGIAPLKKGEFYACKYYNKYLEYTSLGVVGVYSNVEPYTMVVKNGRNGVLCDNTFESWVNQIELLISNPELIDQMYNNAYCDVHNNYNFGTVYNKLLAAIPELCSYYSSFSNTQLSAYVFFQLRRNINLSRLINAIVDEGVYGTIKKLEMKIKSILER